MMKTTAALFLLPFLPLLQAFVPCRSGIISPVTRRAPSSLRMKIDPKRRKELGISDDEEEYDLDVALAANTDPGITKIIAGSFIVAVLALLVVGLVIPSITDYGDGVCSPIQNGGRC
mmetsp:Transcript_1731/g.3698  ORF Transcript_1731/g.3698 Transcript_1731/m.3698 type:complete len:117 (-) Transcript_1731:289-639(-)|eukprot:CAMPEP_0172327606 /NCGR_PEP_ID=MMETSP1058-20130122/59921_1 /TAXON_ID=83371 /ORGANISM="Detonula confervacea, Strain CCMP 353" /LENGTH=116 /DNA_ID=CAMNT_0013044687 /DNA_START=80 /DNA_END=430 /DNA_ORIENTATION=-